MRNRKKWAWGLQAVIIFIIAGQCEKFINSLDQIFNLALNVHCRFMQKLALLLLYAHAY